MCFKYQPHRGARMLEKVLRSALANAEDLRAPNLHHLKVVDVRVDRRADDEADASARTRHGLGYFKTHVAYSNSIGINRDFDLSGPPKRIIEN